LKSDDSLIKQQIEYYRARASEYDEWILRFGRYNRGEEQRKQWSAELNTVRKCLESSHPGGSVLELACGTGLWTERLTSHSERMVAIDSSPEVIELNRKRVANDRVKYILADMFTWKPSENFDFVFFGFWLSHVPASRFDFFWKMVQDSLKDTGSVFFVDTLFNQESTAQDHPPPDQSGRTFRKLNDGRQFEIVKIFYEPLPLKQKLAGLGWKGWVRATDHYFIYGHVSPQ
jgi:demethylmenaquinone methyltransferase/2-methoxy-6-polyprenyl-1,4-benzoquinol methylase